MKTKKQKTKEPFINPPTKYDVSKIVVRRISKKAFNRMNPAAKRVALARDVLIRLRAGKIKAIRGTYLRLVDDKSHRIIENAIDRFNYDWVPTNKDEAIFKTDAQTVVEAHKCEVCAKGSIILSWAANFNKVSLGKIYNRGELKELEAIFPGWMWSAMEDAFENYKWSLEQIMTWLIKHKGNFPFDGIIYKDEGLEYYVDTKIAPSHYPRKR